MGCAWHVEYRTVQIGAYLIWNTYKPLGASISSTKCEYSCPFSSYFFKNDRYTFDMSSTTSTEVR